MSEYETAIERAKRTIAQNAAGNWVRIFDLFGDEVVWVFGEARVPMLPPDLDGPDDPMRNRPEGTVPLEEFHDYLKSYYWPRRKAMDALSEAKHPALWAFGTAMAVSPVDVTRQLSNMLVDPTAMPISEG